MKKPRGVPKPASNRAVNRTVRVLHDDAAASALSYEITEGPGATPPTLPSELSPQLQASTQSQQQPLHS